MAVSLAQFRQQAKAAFDRRQFDLALRVARQGLSVFADDAILLSLCGEAFLGRGENGDACAAYERVLALQPSSARARQRLLVAYVEAARHVEALRLLTQLWPNPPGSVAWYRLGYLLSRFGDWPGAAKAMLLCARLDVNNITAMRSVGECAQQLLRLATPPPPAAPIDNAMAGKISVIVCSIDASKLARLRANLDLRLAGEDWELIHIADARSLCEGYNRGVARARGEIFILCHDDIELLNEDFVARLRGHLAHYDLIGVAGCTKGGGPNWTWAGAPHAHCWVAQTNKEFGLEMGLAGADGPTAAGACLLDGLFLAARRTLFDTVQFDAQTFDGFHYYDLDFSYRAWLAGARVAVCKDLAIFHASPGTFDEVHAGFAERFMQKFPELRQPAPANINLTVMELESIADAPLLQRWLTTWIGMSTPALVRDAMHAFADQLAALPDAQTTQLQDAIAAVDDQREARLKNRA